MLRPVPRTTTEPKQERSQATRRRLLDAAVDELVEHGYAKLTTAGVAARAGVSRGAQQHHFPEKAALVSAAVRHLAALQLDELREASGRVPSGRARVERLLDLSFEQYAGRLFAVVLELMLAARGDDELRASIVPAEREIGSAIHDSIAELYGEELAGSPGFDDRLRHALGATRGLALLRLFGHSQAAVNRQWRFTRRVLVDLLAEES